MRDEMSSAKEDDRSLSRMAVSMGRSNGFVLGLAAVLGFSLTLPMVRLAVSYFGVPFVSVGRTACAGCLALLVLALLRDRFPREHAVGLLISSLGGMVAYPVLTALGLQHAPASHAVIITGFMPSLTAVFATVRGGERPSPFFWLACAAGALAVSGFAVVQGAGHIGIDDLSFFFAALACSYGYAEGAIVAKAIGGPRLVLWGQAMLLPLTLPAFAYSLMHDGVPHVSSPIAWLAFADLVCISALIGFFMWYMALARGGTARIGQLQLLQLPMSCLWCALFLGEHLDTNTLIAAGAIVLSAFATMLTRPKHFPAQLVVKGSSL